MPGADRAKGPWCMWLCPVAAQPATHVHQRPCRQNALAVAVLFGLAWLVQVLHKATTLHFEFSSSEPCSPAAPAEGARALTTIHVPDLDSFTESEHQILAELVRRYKVPMSQR